ncbi:MAG: DUF4434 domain-containing protein [Ignavibacteria bacterium]|nr:DUF4434 domain-containing protein [Ignavibacteria bacterium]
MFFFAANQLSAQNIITFDKNIFQINDQPFFPIGWYECNTIEELAEIREAGANVTLVLWDFLIRANNGAFTPESYKNVLHRFLLAADSLEIKVIIQLPFKKEFSSARESENAIVSDQYINTLVPHFKDYPALLGWYLADEPEAVTNWKTEPYYRLQNWYRLIKTIDPNHPVFVCIANGYELENQTVRPVGPQNEGNPFKMEPFFDILMEDHYAIFHQDSVPSSKLGVFDKRLRSLYDCFEIYNRYGLTAYSTILVTQGYGGSISGHRNPDPIEIKYSVISSLAYAQNSGYPNPESVNAGGIFFWRYGAANRHCKDDINSFINYFTRNSLDVVLSQRNINYKISNDQYYPLVETFLRYWNGSFYLFAINRSDDSAKPEIKLNIGDYSICYELKVPYLTNKQKNLIDIGEGYHSLKDTFSARESKVYLIKK